MAIMSQSAPDLLTFRLLYKSPIVSVRDFVCRACREGPGVEEYSATNDVVLLRHGAFCKHFGSRHIAADVNQAVYFSKGTTYRVSHPGDCGDRGTTIAVSGRILCDIVREIDPSIDEHPDRPFPSVTGPCEPAVFRQHRELVLRLESASAEPLEHLWADVTALQLVALALEGAFARLGRPRKRRRRQGTDADHAARAEAAKTYLASRLSEPITLDAVAQAVHSSPFHLARVFQEQTGVPLHRYLMRLRLRAALERIAGGATTDLTALALELGFSSHSHFADAFRREFGRTPSEARPSASARWCRQVSKNLEV
jgi:AraC family transcriptional regulator